MERRSIGTTFMNAPNLCKKVRGVSSCFSTGLETVAKAPERWLHSSPALFHCRRSGTYRYS